MDIQFQELIEKIKKDGIAGAQEDARRLRSEAEEKARQIVETAQKEAADITARAKEDAKRSEAAGIAAVEQASRNLILDFKGKIEALLDGIILKDSAKAYDEGVLKSVIPQVVKGWADGKGAVNVILDEKDLSALKTWAQGALSAEISRGVELKAGKGVGAGFRIGEKDGSAYYDFSAQAVADALSEYLNPALAEILKKAAKG